MKVININSVDLNNAFFHFTLKSNLESIEENGLKALSGDASNLVKDDARVYLSKGGKGLLGIKNSFIYEFKKLRICDIPVSYRKYFGDLDYCCTNVIEEELIYETMAKRFLDEIYLVVDAVEKEDYIIEDVYGISSEYDIKGIKNHDIPQNKLSLLITNNGNSALDVIRYVYDALLKVTSRDIMEEFLGDLTDFFDFLDNEKELNR